MITFDQFTHALALVESQDVPNAIGDNGRALGPYQMHPDFCDTYYPDTVQIGWTWRDFYHACLLVFWNTEFGGLQLNDLDAAVNLAMKFHLGVGAVSQGKWDATYAERFRNFLAQV